MKINNDFNKTLFSTFLFVKIFNQMNVPANNKT